MTRTDVQTYARLIAILFLLSFVAGGFGEAYVPSRIIVSGDANATALNIRTYSLLFRMGFAAYLVEACCDTALALLLYVLLQPVRRDVPLLILGGAAYLNTFSPGQLNTLALLALRFYAYGAGIFTVFYGIAWLLRGYLIFRSEYLPRFLGVLLVIGGLGFIGRNFLLILAPAYASDALLLLLMPGALSLSVWLLVKGVDLRAWNAKQA